MNNRILPAPYKVSWVVSDIDKAVAKWSEVLGVSEWNQFDYQTTEADMVVGTPFLSRFAQASMGNGMTFEMIQPAEGDSVWQRYLDANGESFHLLSFSTPDNYAEVTAALKAQGAEVLAEAVFDGLHWCYMELDVCGKKRFEITEEAAS